MRGFQLLLLATVLLGHCAEGLKVLVSGAGGKTGSLVVEKLLEQSSVTPLALVRTKKSGKKLRKKVKVRGRARGRPLPPGIIEAERRATGHPR